MPMWCVAPLEINEGNSLGARVQSPYRLRPFLVTRVSVFRIREILQCDLFCIACEDVLVHMRSDKLYDSTDQDEDTGFILGHYPNTKTS